VKLLDWFYNFPSNLSREILDAGGRPLTAPIQFSVVSTLQQLFNRGCCFYHKRLFIEFFCESSCAALKKAPAYLRFFWGIVDNTIAGCLVLLD
jgi:hypothetical protein